MLKLNLKTEPYWIDLPGGVKLLVKPISTAFMSAAKSMAIQRFRKLEGYDALLADNQPLSSGISESLVIKSLAQLAIIEWQGVWDEKANALAPLNNKNIDDLMDIWLVAQEFFSKYVLQLTLLETEGNESAPAAIGTIAADAPIASSAV